MDNASKALIMAGETLIAILIISAFVFLNSVMGNFSRLQNERIEAKKISIQNANFLKYDGNISVSATEVISLINYAKMINDNNNLFDRNGRLTRNHYDSVDFVKVYIDDEEFFKKYYLEGTGMFQNDYKNESKFRENLTNWITKNNTNFYSIGAKIVSVDLSKMVIKKELVDDSFVFNKKTGYLTEIRIKKNQDNRYNITNFNDFSIETIN